MPKKVIDKALAEEFFGYVYKYENLNFGFRNVESLGQMGEKIKQFQNIEIEAVKSDTDSRANLDEIYFMLLDVLRKTEKDIIKKEDEKKQPFPTFGFDIDKIVNHCSKKIDNITERLEYFSFIMKEYPNHLILRMNTFIEYFQEQFDLNDLLQLTKQLSEFFMNEIIENKSDYALKKAPLSFEQRIKREYSHNKRLLKLSNYNGNSLKSTVKLIKEVSEKDQALDSLQLAKDIKHHIDNRFDDMMKQPPRHDDDLLTVKEVMQLLKISRATFERRTKEGIIQKTYIGKKVYVKWGNLKKLICNDKFK